MRRLGYLALGLAVVYAAACGAFYLMMRQPPEAFARGMSRLPSATMMALPFPVLWNFARAGALQIGDEAPDFDLETLDHKSRVRLSSYRGDRPVVLVFGSYT